MANDKKLPEPTPIDGILNSALEPVSDMGIEKLRLALREHDYLIALLQNAAFRGINYSVNDKRFADVTPNEFREVVNAALLYLEGDLWAALRKFEEKLAANGISPWPGYEPDEVSCDKPDCKSVECSQASLGCSSPVSYGSGHGGGPF